MNHMTTTKMWYFGANKTLAVDSDDEDTESSPDSVTLRILRIGNIANNARLTKLHTPSAASRAVLSSTQSAQSPGEDLRSRWVGAPTDVAMMDLVDRFKESDIREALGHRLGETPFSSERKWMGVTVAGDRGRDAGCSDREVAYIKGAIDKVLGRCTTYLTSEGREIVLDPARRQEALQAAEKLAEEGLRVLAFASGTISRSSRIKSAMSSRSNTPGTRASSGAHPPPTHDEDVYSGLTFAGIVGMSDPPRYGVTKSISRLMKGGVRVIMITGDAETTAIAIAKKLGMPIAAAREHSASSVSVRPVLRGDEIDEMTDEELQGAIGNTSIFARTSPDHKLKIIRALQARGDIVAMTGDGVNDAPALKKADIGISMGLHGTDVAKEAADMILTDDDFSTILHAIEEGKGIFSNVQNFLTFQLSTSAAALSLVFICTCLGYRNPLNAMQILWISEPFPSYRPHLYLLTHARHHHGWPTSSIPRRRTSRCRRDGPTTTTQRRSRVDMDPHPTRPHFRICDHDWHDAGLHSRDARWSRLQARHHDDIHMFRALRHVQCSIVPLGIEVRSPWRSWIIL
jgi:Ca2+-transporting ATPase